MRKLIVGAVAAATMMGAAPSADAFEQPFPTTARLVYAKKVTEGQWFSVWHNVPCNNRYNGWRDARRAGHRLAEEAPAREECKVDVDINEGTAERGYDYFASLSENPRLMSPYHHAGRDDVWVSDQQVFQIDGMAHKDQLREGTEYLTVDFLITTRTEGGDVWRDWQRVRVDISDYYKRLRRVSR